MRLLIAQYFGAWQLACLQIMPSPGSQCFRIRLALRVIMSLYGLSSEIWLLNMTAEVVPNTDISPHRIHKLFRSTFHVSVYC